ncbi:hypothetical protein DB31_2797 [Hyalangium minutum]|uniref:Uncharacterized protein n=1 Tax=Hyalangium minutum TaxID=394096 RepID=A0A085W691_9BACT|nr:hypothetical protein DB31_2797 [Hyalangium minutum]
MSSAAPADEVPSIKVPQLLGVKATPVGVQDTLYRLDGTTVRALAIATQDFFSSSGQGKECWQNAGGHRYELFQQEGITFVHISADLVNCWQEFAPMDYGVTYAISAEGRILRRISSGEPDDPYRLPVLDSGGATVPQDKDLSGMLGSTSGSSHIAIPLSWLDGGSPPPRGAFVPSSSIPDGGPRPDGGLPSEAGSSPLIP